MRKGDVKLAKNDLLKAIELKPDYLKARMLMGEIYLGERNFDMAKESCQKVLAKLPDNFRAWLVMGNALLYQGKKDEAKKAFEKLIELDPKNPIGYYRLGLVYRFDKKYDLAMEYYEKALKLNPKLMDVFTNLIVLLTRTGKADKALEKCDKQLEIVKESDMAAALVYSLKGGIYFFRKKIKQAQAAFKKSIEKNPNSVRPYYALAKIYLMEKNADKAIEQFKAVISKNPNKAGPHMLLATIYDMQKKPDLSEKHYRKALKINENFAPAANNLAYLLVQNGKNLNEALNFARKAKELMPDNPYVADTLGWVYYKKGLYESAIGEFSESLKKMEDNATINFHMGMAYYGNNQKDLAAKYLKKALELNKNFEGADKARKILSEL